MVKCSFRKGSLRSQIVDLKKGDTVSFPLSLTATIRATASLIGLSFGRQYRTNTDREKKLIYVTRES